MKTMIDRITEAGRRLKAEYGEVPTEKVKIFIVTNSTAKSNMSGKYSAYIMSILDREMFPLVIDYKVNGCGLDRRYELAYNIFCSAYGYNNPAVRYQDFLVVRDL